MQKKTLLVLIAMLFFLAACISPKKLAPNNDKPYVVLKLDDLWYEHGLVHPGWQKAVDYLNEQKVIGTIGLICDSLEDGDSTYYQWIKQRHSEGYEIWHHGYCHCKPTADGAEQREFRGMDYDYQLENLMKAQHLAREKLGIIMHSFGAPYNSTDDFTAQAMAQIPDLKVWMYKETKTPTDKFVLPRIAEVNIEYPVHIPDFEQFKSGYEQFINEPILVIQGHPRSWAEDKNRFEAFKQIVTFLKSEGVRFTTPYVYYQMQKENL